MAADTSPLVLINQMKKAAPQDRLKLRKQLLEMMNPELRQWFAEVEEKITHRIRENLIFYWKLGQEASQVHESENKYGAKAIEICMACLQEDKGVLYKSMHFFRDFTEEELEHLLSMRMKDTNRPILWSHIVVLLSVDSKSKRNQYINKLVAHNWTDEELKDYIEEQDGKNPNGRPNSGRKNKVPQTIDKMLHHLDQNLSPMSKKFREVWNHDTKGILRLVQKTEPGEFTPGMLAEINRMKQVMEATIEGAKATYKALDQAGRRVAAGLQQQAKADASDEVSTLANGHSKKGKKELAVAAE